MSSARNIAAGVALVAATTLGGSMALAANPPAGATGTSDQKDDVAQGQAELANSQAGTDEAKDVANNEIDNASENDGQVNQVGEKDETGAANQSDSQDNETGTTGATSTP